jgi:chromosome segregation ATPase
MTRKTSLVWTLLGIAAALAPCRTDAQNKGGGAAKNVDDGQQGRYNEMTERYDLWRAEQASFDTAFARHLRDSNEAKSRSLCGQQHDKAIARLRRVLAEQIDAQKDYFAHKKQEADDAIKRTQTIIASASDLALRMNAQLDNARNDLVFLRKQLDDLLSSKRAISDSPPEAVPKEDETAPSGGRKPASTGREDLRRLQASIDAMVKAIKLQEEKIASLEGAMENSVEERRALLNANDKFAARQGEAQKWISLIDAQRVYWTAYLDMRAAQLVEVCDLDDIQAGRSDRRSK